MQIRINNANQIFCLICMYYDEIFNYIGKHNWVIIKWVEKYQVNHSGMAWQGRPTQLKEEGKGWVGLVHDQNQGKVPIH